MSDELDQCRREFEAWAESKDYCIHRDDTEKYLHYHRATTRFAWEAWQAARRTPQEAAQPAGYVTEVAEAKDFIIARLEGRYAERVRRGAVMEAALRTIMRMADDAKEPCGMSPESPAAIRNGKFASIAQVAAQGLGWVSGPPLDAEER